MTPLATAAEFAAALAEPRAYLYLSVDWSGPERQSRRAVAELVEAWRQCHPGVPVPCYAVNDDADTATLVAEWVAASGLPAGLLFSGAGPLLWLRFGRAELHVVNAGQLGAAKLLAASESVWLPAGR